MKISNTAATIKPSPTRRLFNLAQSIPNVIDLTLGDPDMPPERAIKEAACEAITNGRTRYSANAGLIELRQQIARTVSEEYGVSVDPEAEVIVTVGAMEALFLALACLLDAGDEVLIPAPYYVNYAQMVTMLGGVPIFVGARNGNDFSICVEDLEQHCNDRTVAVILNSPCNPTGYMINAKTADAIAEFARNRRLTILSDEVYRTLTYDQGKHESVFTRPGMKERTILVDSVSKRFAMTGYRIGYAIAPADFVSAMVRMQENVAACASLPSQYAACEALRSCRKSDWIQREFEYRRDVLCDILERVPELHIVRPNGAIYLFMDISATRMNDEQFAEALLFEESVAVVPGSAYGESYSNYVRLAFTLNDEELAEAGKRITSFVVRHLDN